MKNAHLRIGWLTYVKSTEKTTTSIKLRLDRFIGMPDWGDWFARELETHKAIIRALGIGCAPVVVKGEKEQFLSWLSWGVENGAISLPAETGAIRWPSFGLEDMFLPPN